MPFVFEKSRRMSFRYKLVAVQYREYKYLTIVWRDWDKYRDLSVVSRSTICRGRRLRQIINLRGTDKSRFFAMTEFNNCFIVRSPSLFSYCNYSLTAQGSELPFFTLERGCKYARAEYSLQQNTFRRYHAWADHYLSAVICSSRGGLSANENEENTSND